MAAFLRQCCIAIALVALLVGLGGWLTHRYFHSALARDAQGRPIEGLKLSEIGDFARPEFRPAVQGYVENTRTYRGLRYWPCIDPKDLESAARGLTPRLAAGISKDPKSAQIRDRWPAYALESLAQHLSLMLSRCAGLSQQDYLMQLGPDCTLRLPDNRDMLRYTCDTFLGSDSIPDPPDGKGVGRLFGDLYSLGLTHRSGANQVAGWADDDAGVACALDEAPPEVKRLDVLAQRLDAPARKLFIGSISQGAFVFSCPPEGHEATRARQSKVLWAQSAIVVSTRSGDQYPILFESYFDAQRKRWWLARASRQSSPRLANTPHLVF